MPSAPEPTLAAARAPSAARALLVGAGGLGCAAGLVLARAAHRLPRGLEVTVIDDDTVSPDNLHRQVFYEAGDVGAPKAALFAERFEAEARACGATSVRVGAVHGRLVPENARELVRAHDLVIEGADNFATKFLTSDAARLEARAVVHAGVVRWAGYALSTGPESAPCYRCFFEDLPREQPDTCAIAGVVGPLVAVVGALQARLALSILLGRDDGFSRLVHVDALRGGPIRARALARRHDCPSCGERPTLRTIDPATYGVAACA